MSKSARRFDWLRPLGMTLLLLVGPALLYFLFHVQARETLFTKQKFRRLAETSTRIQDEIESISTVVKNAFKNSCSSGADEPLDTMTAGAFRGSRKERIQQAVQLSPLIESLTWENASDVASDGSLVVRTSGPRDLSFLYREVPGGQDKECDTLSDSSTLVVSTTFARLLDDVDPVSEFADVFVADATGSLKRIIHQENDTQVHLSHFTTIAGQMEEGVSRQSLDLETFGGVSRKIRVELGGQDYWLFLQPVHLDIYAWTDPTSPGGANALSATGEDNPPVRAQWILGGLIEVTSFASTTFRIGFTRIVSVILLLVLAPLLGPFLKLRLIGASERFRRVDLAALTVCGVFAVGLLTMLVLDAWSYRELRARLERSLEDLSDRVLEGLQAELRGAYDQLTAAKPSMAKFTACALATDRPVLVGRMFGTPHYPERWPAPDCASAAMLAALPVLNPNLHQLIWLSGDREGTRFGHQMVKWSVEETPTLPSSYADRAYFKDVLDERLVVPAFDCLASRPTCSLQTWDANALALTRIRSRSTGESRYTVSIPFGREPAGVLVASGTLRSLQARVPEGMGFVMLDRNGDIEARSGGLPSVGHNFPIELDRESAKLSSAIFAGRPTHLDLHFWSADHLAFVRPLPSIDRTLVAFADLDYFDAASLETAMVAVVSFLLYVGAAAVLLTLARLVAGRSHVHFWPHRRKARAYFECSAALAMLIVGAFFFADRPEPFPTSARGVLTVAVVWYSLRLYRQQLGGNPRWWRPIVAALAGLVLIVPQARAQPQLIGVSVLVLGIVWLWRLRLFRNDTEPSPSVFERGYFASGLLLLVVVAVFPAYVVYRSAEDQVARAFEHAHRHAAESALESERIRRADTYGRVLSPDHIKRLALDDQRRPYQCEQGGDGGIKDFDFFRAWPAYLFECEPSEAVAPSQIGFDTHLPTLYQAVAALLPHYSDGALTLRLYAADGTMSESSVVPVPRITRLSGRSSGDASKDWFSTGVLGLLTAAIGAAVVLMWSFVARHVFGLWALPGEVEDTASIELQPGEKGRVLVRVPPSRYRAFLQTPRPLSAYHLDLRFLRNVSAPLADLDEGKLESAELVILVNLTDRVSDPVRSEAKLQILEYLVYERQKPVIVLSDAAPLPLLTDYARRESGRTDPPTGMASGPSFARQLDRWTALLADLDLHYFRHRADPALPVDGSPPTDAHVALGECAWNEELAALARRLAAEPGLAHLSRTEMLERFLVDAEPIYTKIWNLRTREEKRVLVSLATDLLVNPRGWRTAARLARTQLVVRDPAYRIACESFRMFLSKPELVEEFRRSTVGPASLWTLARVPFFAVIVLATVFLFYTQQDVFENALGFLATLSASFPVLVRMLGFDDGSPT